MPKKVQKRSPKNETPTGQEAKAALATLAASEIAGQAPTFSERLVRRRSHHVHLRGNDPGIFEQSLSPGQTVR